MGRPNAAVVLSEQEREQLEALTRSRSMPHALVRRATIVLLSAAGLANEVIAQRCAVSPPTVSLWRQRYRTQGLAGLHDELRSGRGRHFQEGARRLKVTLEILDFDSFNLIE